MAPKVKAAEKKRGTKRPQNWDKAISVAYLRLLGATQVDAAERAGVSERVIRDWEISVWWKDAIAEARGRWLRGVESGAMNGILEGLGDPNEYAAMARWAAERILPEMAPPKHKLEASGVDGKDLNIQIVFKKPDGE
jgi:hypothetical protein